MVAKSIKDLNLDLNYIAADLKKSRKRQQKQAAVLSTTTGFVFTVKAPTRVVSHPMFDDLPKGFDLLDDPVSQSQNDIQHGGDHYKGRAIQPWDYIAANNLCFFTGNAVKYVTRWQDKGGIEDLRKAVHYLQKKIEIEEMKNKEKE